MESVPHTFVAVVLFAQAIVDFFADAVFHTSLGVLASAAYADATDFATSAL